VRYLTHLRHRSDMIKACVLVLSILTSCSAERVRVRTLSEGRLYDDKRPILHGPTKGQQRPGIPK